MSQARHVFGRYEANMRSHTTNRPEQEAEKSLEGEDNKARQDLEADVYKVASTGAQVTLASAKPLLYTFCGKLAYDKWPPHAAFACAHCWYSVWNTNFHGCNDVLSTSITVCLDFLGSPV